MSSTDAPPRALASVPVRPGVARRLVTLRRTIVGAGVAAVVLAPSPIEAHLVKTGLGPVHDGITHVLVSPDDLLPIVVMGFLAGLNGPKAGRQTLFALSLAWLIGGAAGFASGHAWLPAATTAMSFLVLGGLTAADVRLSPTVVTVLAIIVGLLHGWLNGVGIGELQRESIGLLGIAAATFVLVALAAALAVSLRAPWMRIAFRVSGSWLAAIGLLMAGWALRGGF